MTAPGAHGFSVGSAFVARLRTADVSASWAAPNAAVADRSRAISQRWGVPRTFMPDLLELSRQRQTPADLLGGGANESSEAGKGFVAHPVRRSPYADAADDLTVLPEDGGADPPGGRVEVLVGDRVALGPDPGEDCLQAAAVDDGLVRVARQLAEPVEDRLALALRQVRQHRLGHGAGVQGERASQHGHEPHALGAVALV